MNVVGRVRRLLARQMSYKRVGSAHSGGGGGSGNGNGIGPGRRRRLSDPPSHESEEEEEDDSDPYVEDDGVAHGPFVYAAFVMLGLAMLLRMPSILSRCHPSLTIFPQRGSRLQQRLGFSAKCSSQGRR